MNSTTVTESKPRFVVMGANLSSLPSWAQMTICWCGVMCCYGSAGIALQYILESFAFRNTLLISTFIPFTTVVLGGAAGGLRAPRAPLQSHAIVGLLSLCTIQLSNWSFLYLNYVTQVLFKCAKILPVMIMGTLVWRKHYRCSQYLAAGMLFFGLSIFVLADQETVPNFQPVGILIMCGALSADAFIGNYQESMFNTYKPSELEANTWASVFSLSFSLILLIFTQGSLALYDIYVAFSDTGLLTSLLVFSTMNFLGIWFVLAMIQRFGAAQTVFATSLRKAGSVLVSYVLFPKPFLFKHGLGLLLIAKGIYVMSISKSSSKPSEKLESSVALMKPAAQAPRLRACRSTST